jgi:hypothetical protein
MVCRHNASHLTPLQREIFAYAFYGFDTPNKYRRYAGDVMHTAKELGEFTDYNLPRGCYYAICNTRQMEHIHLSYELKAYTNTKEVGPFLLANASARNLCLRYALEPVADSLFTLLNPIQIEAFLGGTATPSSPRRRDPTEVVAFGEGLGRQLGAEINDSYHSIPNMNWEGILVYFPLEKCQFTTVKCIDLRLPDTRQWFFRRYRRGIEGWPGYGYDAADVAVERGVNGSSEPEVASGFIQMLPSLCDHAPGGRLICQVIGADLRRHGAECLVYPSARCDVFAAFQDGVLVDSYGWNLVDYTHAGAPRSPAEEGIVYVFLEDIVLGADGQFARQSSRNAEKVKDIDRQVRRIREITGKEPRAVLADPYNPWIPKEVFPFVQADVKNPFSFSLDVDHLREHIDSPQGAWPYKIIDIEEGEQRGSLAIEGVQKAYDEREAALAAEYIKNMKAAAE